MSNKLLLITGVSGHVGFRVLVEALSQGYRARAVVRKSEQVDQIKNAASIKSLSGNLEFVVVKDLLQDGAFDNVLDQVNAVVHVASPLPLTTNDYKRDIIDPAVLATTSLLKSTAKAPQIKRVVVTSSMAAILSMEYTRSADVTKVFTARDTYPPPDAAGPFASPFDAYVASKSHALAASEQFIEREKPGFDLISVLPSMVIGKHELHSRREDVTKSTNNLVIAPLIGVKKDAPTLGASVHLNDVARAHIDALKLEPTESGTRRLLCSSNGLTGTVWEDAKAIVRQLYPKEVEEGLFPLTGTAPSRPLRLDSSETEQVLGWSFTGFQEQVTSVVDQYIDLAA
ncbi:NAD(P)-binding protein [Plenodomus tracheiphilus IPT5]|uniref:NAD(P)-binding protein n=1 Tax=Plenodomus tracheiphilus IPT5 TaxID=1408161 RepID=A0A6A7AXF6_9PLEO|nr:NAD(P)-binding protein [Plenodomus tracheiphilus IPT5]